MISGGSHRFRFSCGLTNFAKRVFLCDKKLAARSRIYSGDRRDTVLLDQRQELKRGAGGLLLSPFPLAHQIVRDVEIVCETVWLTCSRTRRALIRFGDSGCTGVRQVSSNRRMVCLSMAPILCRASIVSWTEAIPSLRYFLLISFYLHKVSFLDQLCDLLFRQSQRWRAASLKCFSSSASMFALSFFAKPYTNNARSPCRKRMIVRYPPDLPRPRDPLLDNSAPKIGVHLAFSRAH
jgi:hypothetical protein